VRNSPFHPRQVSGWYVPLPDYTTGFHMPEAAQGAAKDFKLKCRDKKVKS